MNTGDNILVSHYLFGNTYSLLKDTFPGYGLETRFIDILDEAAIESAIGRNTRALFLETISNPQMIVPDIKKIAAITRKHGILLIVDATVVTPWLFDPKEFGADVVIHSTTKFISGGATSVGGALVDLGVFDWTRIPALKNYHHLGENALIARLKKEIFRNFGACMAPQTAFLQCLGLETLALRVNQSCDNTLIVAERLSSHPKVATVYYPGLTDSPFHDLSKRQFKGRFGGILGFELKDRKTCFEFMNKLELVYKATNLNDNNSLIIHPASTIFCDFTEEQKKEVKVSEGLLRLSVGIGHVDDIMDDMLNALEAI
jgi:O-acetylhomoserine (thiol)-lyase